MSNLIDADAGTERFGGYEAELKLVQADLSQQIEQIKETTGEPRKAAISRAERALEEADELVRGHPSQRRATPPPFNPALTHPSRSGRCASRNPTSPPT